MLKTSHTYYLPLLEAAKASPKLADWLGRRGASYEEWVEPRVGDVAARAVATVNAPIARAALTELLGPEKAKHLDFAKVHAAFAALDTVQGGRVRIFTHQEWDRGVDTYEAVRTEVVTRGPEAAEAALARLRTRLLPGEPSVPNGSRFATWGDFTRAVEAVQESKYRQPLPGLDQGNVTVLPFHTIRHEERQSSYDALCALTFSVEKGKTSDKLLLVFHPIVTTRLSRMRPDERPNEGVSRAVGAYAIPSQGLRWHLRVSRAAYAHEPWGPVFFSDHPVTYAIRLDEDGLKSVPRALRQEILMGLESNGYKVMAPSPRNAWGWGAKGPRAVLADEFGFYGLRHPGAS